MKRVKNMFSIIIVLLCANIYVFKFNNTVEMYIVAAVLIGPIIFYKALISEKFSDIYNIHSFKYKFNSRNMLELIGAFLMSSIVCKLNFMLFKDNVLNIGAFVIFGLLSYRFLFFNLAKGTIQQKNKEFLKA